MKKLYASVLGLTFASAVALTASAADMSAAPRKGGYQEGPAYVPMTWNGLYGGASLGYGWAGDDGALSPSGGFAGGQVGYNWQGALGLSPNVVLGVEADLQDSRIADSAFIAKSSLNWFGTVRGRIGYAAGRTLIYGTAGFAYGEVENAVGGFKAAKTQTGYVLGGGVEYRLNPSWSVKGEYQLVNLDAGDFAGAGPLGFTAGDRSEANTVRLGVNYHVDRGFEPLK